MPRPSRFDTEAARAAILATVARIPVGRVASYGQVAFVAGYPGRARLVGKTLGGADGNSGWHRVLGADGRVSLPDFAPAYAEQHRRLAEEGVVFLNGRLNWSVYRWQPGDSSPLLDP